MTFGEIRLVLKYYFERRQAAEKAQLQTAAFSAFYGAYYSRVKNFPGTLKAAFPEIFGMTETGGISATNWQESKRAMDRLVERHNRIMERKEAAES